MYQCRPRSKYEIFVAHLFRINTQESKWLIQLYRNIDSIRDIASILKPIPYIKSIGTLHRHEDCRKYSGMGGTNI